LAKMLCHRGLFDEYRSIKNKDTVIGVCLTSCGTASNRCSLHGSHTRWGGIGPVSMIVTPWMPFFSCCVPGASGTHWWNALNETGLCSSSSAHRRFQEWTVAGVFLALWTNGLAAYEALKGIDWEWLAMDGAMTKAPLGGKKGGQESDRSR
jgi:hypothetical protein